jgi:hypothetical protein
MREGDNMLRKAYFTLGLCLVFLLCGTMVGLSESDEPSEPIYENDYHYERPLRHIVNEDGYLSVDAFIEIYDEPQEGDDSEGFDAGHSITWDEPFYYKGSTKKFWFTYDGFGINIKIIGPDAAMNTHVYIEISSRYFTIYIEGHVSTGLIPV